MTEDFRGFDRFEDKEHQYNPKEPAVTVTDDKIVLNSVAKQLTNKSELNYVNVYLNIEENQVALRPVEGGEVDANSYSFKDCSLPSTPLKNYYMGDVDDARYYSVEWDSNRKMWIIDLNERVAPFDFEGDS